MKFPEVVGYKLVERVGGGGFSTVYKAVNFKTRRVAACKVVLIDSETTSHSMQGLNREITVQKKLKHIHILEMLEGAIVNLNQKKYYPGAYMLLEFASGGELFDKIVPDVGIDGDVAQLYFAQFLSGLEYIHDEGVVHRDLKPENILLDVLGRLKICDFGLCSVYKLKETGQIRLLSEQCGTPQYAAPELSTSRLYKGPPIDIWGAGVILFTLLVGNTPWDEPTKLSPEFARYSKGKIFNDSPWDRLQPEELELIKGMLTISPEDRWTISQIKVHPWVMRPSQLASEGQAAIAQRLTEPLTKSGDVNIIDPHSSLLDQDQEEDEFSSSLQSQFTQSLLLFSQTQSGKRYNPRLTRFYSNLPPEELMPLITSSVTQLGVKSKPAPADPENPERLRLRVGGYDRRREMFKGWIEVEPFIRDGEEGSFCMMQRNNGNPISWRQLWKAIIQSETIEPHVLKKEKIKRRN